MLKNLRIQNFAIIDEASLEFGEGLNIISGETGAGKSILMDALVLILGGRASSDLIRRGAEEATVEALFEVSGDSELAAALENQGLAADEELIIRRIVHRSGKNRIFVNGSMVNMATLQAITATLVDLCSQHDQQLLARPEEQLLWIDRFGELESDRAKVKALHGDWKQKKESLEALSTDSAQRAQRIDFLQFQIQELEDAGLSSPLEDQEIQQELKMLENAEDLFGFAAEAEGLLFGSDTTEATPVLDSLVALMNKGRNLSAVDPKLNEAMEHLNNLKIHAEELAYFLRSYSQGVSRDEGRLEELNARLALLTKLKRKYGPTLAEAIDNLQLFRKELALLENHDSSLHEAKEAVDDSLACLRRDAETLSKKRVKAAKEFSQSVVGELADLNMERARFLANFQALEQPISTGVDSVRFDIAANPGEPVGPLNKIASGGELSRVMLAMHNVVSSRGEVGVYLFDEVDSGIGGKTAVAVGAKLQKVSRGNQVICITHLAQVASFADRHFHVEKSVTKKSGSERTVAKVIALNSQERELEIARMLGGQDRAALANARAMLEKANGPKKKTTAPVAASKSEKNQPRARN
jgi:DNA repair protein RecN (Recombination protein N)